MEGASAGAHAGAGPLVVAGATGVVGRHLVAHARRAGLAVRALSRGRTAPGLPADVAVFPWDPAAIARGDAAAAAAAAPALDGARVVVNLAGASLGEGRLDAAHKRRVLESRLDATRALGVTRARCARPPAVWLQASAVGYYGDRGEAEVGEDAPAGADFLADVCARWEAAAREAVAGDAAVRLVVCRIGLVLAPDAPAWRKLIGPIRWGVGGRLGPGTQWWAWIHADDLARALLLLAARDDAAGAFNLTAPEPVRQADLVDEAATLLHRPALFPVPAFALRIATGEVADALLLPSCRAVPRRLLALGFAFERPGVGRALVDLLGPT